VLAKDGILRDVKRLQYYEKPSEKKKKDALAAKRRVTRRGRRPE
jgi:ribosomal protein S21